MDLQRRPGVDVPLGRAGATKRQNLKLGRGTSQHVLIAGKTGSGKSTLMHALITNLALMYSPDEVELYLIDFKKGVEFKTYAQFQLPHARVIAIESEREFGLAFAAARRRTEGSWRQIPRRQRAGLERLSQVEGSERMPRILFIVDEFQEFFVEDDKIAQDVSLLLDRMVRQGRAFGIHVILGSQTLGGAYGLARSTLGQMAIRIALQCSEADANLILSEENSAARLLTRPGEAIYNDANGRLEGNHLFQVVWLSDDRHEDYLRAGAGSGPAARIANARADRLRREHSGRYHQEHAIAGIDRRPGLAADRLGSAGLAGRCDRHQRSHGRCLPPAKRREFDHARAAVRSVVGDDHGGAGGPGRAAAGARPDTVGGAKFYLLDGSPPDAMHVGTLAKLANVLPHAVEVGGPRDVPRIIGELAAELERRQASSESDPPALYLVVYDLPRFRELRKAEDDFGFCAAKRSRTLPSSFPRCSRRARLRDSCDHLVRHAQQSLSQLRAAGAARVRKSRDLPGERGRLQLADRLADGQPLGAESGLPA